MSRVSLIEQLYAPKKKSALEFSYDNLWAPPIKFFLSQQDINELYKIATSLKYNDNIEKKYELIDAIMKPRGFKRGNCGTNRVVYNFLEDTSFCMKIALDRVGIQDSPKEYKNQEFFKPFCCKIFEVDPTGVIACVERVNPISSIEEFASVADDVFNMMVTKIIGKYVVDDLGTEKFLNYGVRYNSNGIAFGPVILDYPYAYELDGAKLHCAKPIQIGDSEYACGGEIDYDAGLNNLVCCKCGRTYSARELAKDDSNILKFYSDDEQSKMRARIIRESDNTILKDSGRSSKLYITKEEYKEGIRMFELKNLDPRPVEKTIKNKYTPMKKLREEYYTELQTKAFNEMQKRKSEPFNPVLSSEFEPRPAKRATSADVEINDDTVEDIIINNEDSDIDNVTIATRAEDINIESDLDNDTFDSEEIIEETESEIDEEDYDLDVEESENDTFAEDSEMEEDLIESGNDEMLESEESEDTDETDLDTEETDYEEDLNENEIIEETVESEDSDEESNYDAEETDYEEDLIIEEAEELEYLDEQESNKTEGFDEEMESEVFPEINNEIVIGVDLSSTTDYSNYIPPEDEELDDDFEEEEEDQYSGLYEVDRKEAKRNNKKQQQNRAKKFNAGDMSDY